LDTVAVDSEAHLKREDDDRSDADCNQRDPRGQDRP
jgi:hypothetical protein